MINIDLEKIKFIPLSQKDLILSLDRLTRFKYPEIKYYRVFGDLLSKSLQNPKLSKPQISELSVFDLKSIVEKIWNESVKIYSPDVKADFNLNKVLVEELYEAYNLTDEIRSLVDIKLNINGVLPLIKKSTSMPINLKRLILIEKDYENLTKKRDGFNLRFPVEKLVLCEGITEEILMPKFSALAGFNFDRHGVKLISAGGKNQVAKLYCELKDELKIPIFILLDADAVAVADNIKTVLRPIDYIHLIETGEFEDTFSLNLIKRTINNSFKNIYECCAADFKQSMPMTKILCELYRINNLGDYKKADFAKQLHENVKYDTDLTEDILKIVDKIKTGI